jgi:nicotinamidase-related amidase
MSSPHRSLIIIDMQKGMQSAKPGRRNNPGAEANIQRLLTHWRATGGPVVHVRHMSRTPGSVFWPGQAGAEFQDALLPLGSEHVLEKNVTDAFANSGLERWLHARAIKELVIVGVSTNMSVEATVRSAGCLRFATTVVSDATFTLDATDLSGALRTAEDIHLMSLSNLNGEYSRVIESAELLG